MTTECRNKLVIETRHRTVKQRIIDGAVDVATVRRGSYRAAAVLAAGFKNVSVVAECIDDAECYGFARRCGRYLVGARGAGCGRGERRWSSHFVDLLLALKRRGCLAKICEFNLPILLRP